MRIENYYPLNLIKLKIVFPRSFRKLIDNFASLPSVGPKMAERLVLHLFKQDKNKIDEFSENLAGLSRLKSCKKCFNISEGELCEFCRDKNRDKKTILAVEEPLDIIPIERTGVYKGLYHVLGGTIEIPTDAKNDLKIAELLSRIKKEKIKEVIIATNPTTEGDVTALYLKRKMQKLGIKISRLGRGLSTGGDIEYADEATLSEALTNRKKLI